MKCPHCAIHFHAYWFQGSFRRANNATLITLGQGLPNIWTYRHTLCPECKDVTIEVSCAPEDGPPSWRMIYPTGANRGPVPPQVPRSIAADYIEACNVLPISPKAAAALARRCLQNMLSQSGYKGTNLAKQIDALLQEPSLSVSLRETVDSIRNFGNFSAHPIDDKSTLQIIDVQPEEAEWCLEIIETAFDFFYVAPAVAQAKKAALNEKLFAAGKPPAK